MRQSYSIASGQPTEDWIHCVCVFCFFLHFGIIAWSNLIINYVLNFVAESKIALWLFRFSLKKIICTAGKVSISGDFLVRIFPHLDWIRKDTPYLSVFSPDAGKYGSEKLRIWILFKQWWSLADYECYKFAVGQGLLGEDRILVKSRDV